MIPEANGWRMVRYSGLTARAQMAIDETLARQAAPTLRLFRWGRPALSYGFRREPPAWAQPDALTPHRIDLVERPTGGGVALHGSDLSCSVTMPSGIGWSLRQMMAAICEILTGALHRWGVNAQWVCEIEQPLRITYCLTQESPYAIVLGERKVCGLAARRFGSGWLIQGSLLVRALPPVFEAVMPAEVWASYQQRAIALEEALGRSVDDRALQEAIIGAWGLVLGGGEARGASERPACRTGREAEEGFPEDATGLPWPTPTAGQGDNPATPSEQFVHAV